MAAGFTAQPDEGYSEDPLTALSLAASSANSLTKTREGGGLAALAASRGGNDFPQWMLDHLSELPISRKTELVMALLNELPTRVVSQIVNQLSPRLYIDFVSYLPPEVCLKILGYLDPVSLINVAQCCRAWYDLALDRKLWEQLYYLEGWKVLPDEMARAEAEMNGRFAGSDRSGVRRTSSEEDGNSVKKRAISHSPKLDADIDMEMADVESSIPRESSSDSRVSGMSGHSIFGGYQTPGGQGIVSGSKSKMADKGKGKELAPCPSSSAPSSISAARLSGPRPRIEKSTLWVWDTGSKRYRLNWKYLYSMRRRLEANWERGKYTNFQFPHPDHPEEGHGECVYTIQYNSQYLVSGSRDRTIKIWDMKTKRCLRTLRKHQGSVLCLQFDSDPEEDIIVSGSSDSDVIIWKFSTGQEVQILKHAHRESVLNVRFDKRVLVTCSKDKTIKVFNRRPLRYGDLGYQPVDPVGRLVKDPANSIPMSPEDYPVIPPWTMIGVLEGHNAAVNAVQVHGREVVSASGDRHIKIWDWPKQTCVRTILAHNKGIACVQYDGRRIVSGSSDNEVKVFDRQSGVEVASLRSHTNLVRTVHAGFGDLPYSVEDDLREARRVDEEYWKAFEQGLLDDSQRSRQGRRQGNAGSRRPQDIRAIGASLPPGGGGGKYGRIVSGSYDASIIVWRRDKEGVWKDQHHFKQEDAALNALRQHWARQAMLQQQQQAYQAAQQQQQQQAGGQRRGAAPPSTTPLAPGGTPSLAIDATLPPTGTIASQSNQPGHNSTPTASFVGHSPLQPIYQIIDNAVQNGPQALLEAIATHPAILQQRTYVNSAIDRLPDPVSRSQLRQAYSGAIIRAQFQHVQQNREELQTQTEGTPAPASTSAAGPGSSQSADIPVAVAASSTHPGSPAMYPYHNLTPAQIAAAEAHQAHSFFPDRRFIPPPPPALAPVNLAGPNPLASHAAIAPAALVSPHVAAAPALQHHPHIAQPPLEMPDTGNPARVFKLQYDARRIICCSQRSVIVGWDFCNGDPELEEASRFFGPIE